MIIALVAIFALLLILLIFAAFILNTAGFGKRCEGNENLKYMQAEDFEHLQATEISFKSDKSQNIRGFLYSSTESNEYKALIIFSHGMGAGHLSYTTEINYFAQKGYLVLAYDNTGTCSSEGKKLYGFAQGIIDLKYALNFATENEKLNRLPILLMGHSWGAYSVCNVAVISKNCDIKGIAAFSPFNSQNRLISDFAKGKIGISLKILYPFFNIINYIHFGKIGLLKSCNSISANSIPTLVMHGERDATVNVCNSPVGMKDTLTNSKAKTVSYENKYHNVYLANDAENYLNDVFGKINSLPAGSDEIKKLYSSIDYELITKEDPEVMNSVCEFFEKCINLE
ncbi:MAG: alpha/beta hydrolase [Oscillospiraceae bacterium]|nr:alpha/beta hydrolase [Oscillospiraceae bacterium]